MSIDISLDRDEKAPFCYTIEEMLDLRRARRASCEATYQAELYDQVLRVVVDRFDCGELANALPPTALVSWSFEFQQFELAKICRVVGTTPIS